MSPTSSTQNTKMPRQITTVLLGLLTGLIIHLYFLLSEEFTFAEITITGITGAMIVGILIAYAALYISKRLNQFIPFERNVGGRLLLGIFFNSLMASISFYLYYRLIWSYAISAPMEQSDMAMITTIKLVILVFVLVFIFSILYYAHYSYQAVVIAQVNQIQLKREIIDIQMDTLKSQLRPHFLFNSLNTISSLMHSSREEAELFIRRLASTYNYTLQNYNKKAILLKDEVDLVTSYVDMMRARFGSNVILKKNIPSSLFNREILPLSLQTLVENALKHNVINDDHQLTIDISVNQDIIRVENNKTLSPSSVVSNNIGLSNLQKRYRLWDDHKVDIYNNEDSFVVTIPIS